MNFFVRMAIVLYLTASASLADDVVVLRPVKRNQPPVEKHGDVADFTGAGLSLRIGSRTMVLPPDQILEIRSAWCESEQTGDRHRAAGNLAGALKAYEAALAEEERPWAKRKLQVKYAACLEWNDQTELAGDEILAILRDDEQSPYFYALPMAWQNRAPNALLADWARRRLAERSRPANALLGASWLLGGENRAEALQALASLGSDLDPRIALLATAQQWRTQVVSATREEVARWEQLLQRLEPELRGGPLLVVAQAHARLKQQDEAALCYLQTALLRPQRDVLAAEGFLAAATLMEQKLQFDEAARLYRELASVDPVGAKVQRVSDRMVNLEKQRTARP